MTAAPKDHATGSGIRELDALVVGGGFSGIYMLHLLRAQGLTVQLVEAGSSVGGTWYWNRYPGARCDSESLQYSYSFSDELARGWHWSSRYAGQPEIQRYLEHVTDRFDLRRDMRFDTRVTSARFDESASRWLVETDRSDRFHVRFCVMASGCISQPQDPDFPGLDDFEGRWYHTGRWPHEGVDFAGERVAVIGTGSTGIQLIPTVAAQAEHLTVFQRTPNYAIPAWDGPLDPELERGILAEYASFRQRAKETSTGLVYEVSEQSALELTPEERERELERRWQIGGFVFLFAFCDILTSEEANEHVAEFARRKIRSRVHDPAVAELLCPRDHPFGTKRLCVDSDYYETYNRGNVTLVDLRATPMVEFTASGLRTTATEYPLDAVVFAIGFDNMTGALFAIDIRGRGGRALREKWAAGPRAYLGLASEGFPNLFTITGPGSPSVLSNMVTSIEQHVEWVADCIAHLVERGIETIEPERDAEDVWLEHVREVVEPTLLTRANSWYMGANVPGKPRVFTPYCGGVGRYRRTCDEVAAQGYAGFMLR
jgi:cyclohexanone monooxygenase